MAGKVLFDLLRIGGFILVLSVRDADTEEQVRFWVVQENLDIITGVEDQPSDRLLVPVLGMRRQGITVDSRAISRLVLDHYAAVLVHVDAEVYVADALARILAEDDIASCPITTKGEAGGRVLDAGRQP